MGSWFCPYLQYSEEMEISVEELKGMIESCCALGAAKIQSVHFPEEDKASKSEAIRFLRRNGVKYPTKVLKDLEDRGLIHRHKRGTRNEKLNYSIYELQDAITCIKFKSFIF